MNDSSRRLRRLVAVVMIPALVFIVLMMAIIVIALFVFLLGHRKPPSQNCDMTGRAYRIFAILSTMPLTSVLIFADPEGSPFLRWVDSLPEKALNKCIIRIERLERLGIELTCTECVPVQHGILMLPMTVGGAGYAILYFFHEDKAVLLHGCTHQTGVATADIALARERKESFLKNPALHTYQEEKHNVPVED